MNEALLSHQYQIRKITDNDIPDVLLLCESNPLYYKYCSVAVSTEEIKSGLAALPPNKTYEDKYYVGFYNDHQLIAVMDLICRYPNDETVFIGFFMVNHEFQGGGVGTGIITECLEYLKSIGFVKVRLGYVKGNAQSSAFWDKNEFKPTGIEVTQTCYTVVIMERTI